VSDLHPESDFSPPKPWCADASAWSAPDTMASEMESSCLIGALVLAAKPLVVVEFGAYHGHTTGMIAEALRRNGRGHIHAYEPHPPNMALAEALIARDGSQGFVILVQAGWQACDLPSIDFAFIDNDGDRTAPLHHITPRLSQHALVVIHDTPPDWAIQHAFADTFESVFVPVPRGLSILRKRP
jgi:predicted O-methyltransferase YrrM